MRYIFFSIALAVATFFATSSFAQNNAPVKIASVNISGATIENKVANVINIPFVISNGEGVQSGVKYSVRLVAKKDPSVVYDETVYEETLTLLEKSTVTKNIIYTAPKNISGTFSVYVVLSNSNGFPFAISTAGDIQLTASEKAPVLSPESCTARIAGKKDANKTALAIPVGLRNGQDVALECTLTNTMAAPVAVVPAIETFKGSIFGESVSVEDRSVAPTVVKSGEKKTITIIIPRQTTPGMYLSRVRLVSGTIRSNPVFVTHTLVGATGSITNITTNADYYDRKETAVLSLIWSGTGIVAPKATVRIVDGDGTLCGSLKEAVITRGKADLSVNIHRSCFNPTISATIFDGEKTLDQKVFSVTTLSREYSPGIFAGKKGTLLLVAILIVLAGLGIYMKRRHHSTTPPALALIIVALTALLPSQAYAGWYSGGTSILYTVGAPPVTTITVDITADPLTMTLPTNQTQLTWITTGNPDTCTASNAWSGTKDQRGGSETITGLTAGNHLFQITCTKAGSVDASSSVLVVVNPANAPSGTLSASGCSIPGGASSCTTGLVSWTTANLTGNPTAITRNTGSPASFTPSPLAGGSQSVTLGYGQTDFYLYHNAVLLAQASAVAACTGGTTWNGSICQVNPPAPTASLTANPTTITLGNSSLLTWSSANATACSGFGFNTGGATSGSVSVSPLSTTTYTVSCTGAGGTADANATVTVTGTPTPQCSDGSDNDSDGVSDINDPGCHTDGNAANNASYDPNDNSELNKRRSIFKEF